MDLIVFENTAPLEPPYKGNADQGFPLHFLFLTSQHHLEQHCGHRNTAFCVFFELLKHISVASWVLFLSVGTLSEIFWTSFDPSNKNKHSGPPVRWLSCTLTSSFFTVSWLSICCLHSFISIYYCFCLQWRGDLSPCLHPITVTRGSSRPPVLGVLFETATMLTKRTKWCVRCTYYSFVY